jgi:hypothetical protein
VNEENDHNQAASYCHLLAKLQEIMASLETTAEAHLILKEQLKFTSAQFLIRDNKVHLLLNARLLDMKDLLGESTFWFKYVLSYVAQKLRLDPGGMHFNIGILTKTEQLK